MTEALGQIGQHFSQLQLQLLQFLILIKMQMSRAQSEAMTLTSHPSRRRRHPRPSVSLAELLLSCPLTSVHSLILNVSKTFQFFTMKTKNKMNKVIANKGNKFSISQEMPKATMMNSTTIVFDRHRNKRSSSSLLYPIVFC